MEVLTARTAGFCMGVRRAVEMALAAAAEAGGAVYSLGPLIHNRQVVEFLAQNGVRVAQEPPLAGTVIIRAHGVGPQVLRELSARGVRVVDATCPHVLSSQRTIARETQAGRECVLAGDRDHPEVVGLAGYAVTPVHIISNVEEARMLRPGGAFFLIAQTTFMHHQYGEIAQELRGRFPDCRVFDSICGATGERQREARALAEACGVLVVAGGADSANTRRLAEVGREAGARVLLVETEAELRAEDFAGVARVGLSAGASTPDWIIEEVRRRLESFWKDEG